jgi:ABC-type Fe3+ transport system permease subunit
MLGYIVGIAGFAIFGLLQGGFAVAIFLCVNFGFNLVMAVTISICCLAVSALLMNNEWYNNQNFMGKH